MPLPTVLAGPIIRRAESTRVLLWLATSEPLNLGAQIYGVNTSMRPPLVNRAAPLGEGVALRRVRLGAKLFVHLIAVVPRGGAGTVFPARRILAYDILQLSRAGDIGSATGRRLKDLMDVNAVRLEPFELPTFVLQRPERNELVALYASCRKLHGKGGDASAAASALVISRAANVEQRPTALFLGGDQIYADDVSDLLIREIARLGEELQGGTEPSLTIGPGVRAVVRTLLIGARQVWMDEEAYFTSTEAGNHLITFGEFAATYLLAWNPDVWPAQLPSFGQVWRETDPRIKEKKAKERYDEQRAALEDARRAGAGLRKVLANTPTYMIFDDHEVTDDWNLNDSWTKAVIGRPLGRRIISNALAAFWAFQGWGNAPEVYDPTSFIRVIEDRLTNLSGDATDYERTLLQFQQWSFVAPTQPKAVFLDTRTGREAGRASLDWRHPKAFGTPLPQPIPVPRPPFPRSIRDIIPNGWRLPLHGNPAQLMGLTERDRLRTLCASLPSREPTIFVAPAPVFGFEMIEGLQDIIARMVGSYAFDLEHWHANPDSLLDFMELIFELRPAPCVLLSGDVHYAFEGMGEVKSRKGVEVRVGQFTSSAMKNQAPGVMAAAGILYMLAGVLNPASNWPGLSSFLHRTVYWRLRGGENHILNDLLLQAAYTAFHGHDPDLLESIEFQYLGNINTVLGENNVGELRVRNREVTHRLHFARAGGGTGSTPEHRL